MPLIIKNSTIRSIRRIVIFEVNEIISLVDSKLENVTAIAVRQDSNDPWRLFVALGPLHPVFDRERRL